MSKIMNATLLHIDCMEYMAGLPDKVFDLAIVDPPYGIERFQKGSIRFAKGENCRDGIKWDKKPTAEYFKELRRVSTNQIVWGANHFWDGNLGNATHFIFWDKEQPVPNFAAGELAWTSFPGVAKKITLPYYGNINVDHDGRIHPTQKPIKLYEWLLANYAKPGQRILDTHLGSGSSAIACNNLGFEMVGCELDADYYRAACARVEQATKQERLFA